MNTWPKSHFSHGVCSSFITTFWLQDDRAETVDDLAVKRLLQADIDNVLHTLSPRECGVLRMRYGLDDGEEKTLEEIGLRYKVRRLQRQCRKSWYRQLWPRRGTAQHRSQRVGSSVGKDS